MNYRYFWKELTSKGKLKDPPIFNEQMYADPDMDLNKIDIYGGDEGHITEEAAVAWYLECKSRFEYQVPSELVLIKVYSSYKWEE